MSSAAAADAIVLPPGYRFVPTDDELVEFYLLPRARGQPAPFPGVLDDDAAGTALPWDLLERHGRDAGTAAYYCVRAAGDGRGAGARQDRACEGGFKWRSQKRLKGALVTAAGEAVQWSKNLLNLHRGDGGSIGWVMHEYTITSPPCPSHVKICHIAVTAQAQKRKRVHDDANSQAGSASQRPRVAAAAAAVASPSWTPATYNQDFAGECPSAAADAQISGTPAMVEQGPTMNQEQQQQQQHIMVSGGEAEGGETGASLYWDYADSLPPLVTHDELWQPLESTGFPSAASSANAEPCFQENAMATAATAEQPVEHTPTTAAATAEEPVEWEELYGDVELEQLCGDVDLQELLASMQDDLGSFCGVPGIDDGDMAAGTVGRTDSGAFFCG
ncbi:hypothetical protein ACP4OV_022299 [Aristida adscensionis]